MPSPEIEHPRCWYCGDDWEEHFVTNGGEGGCNSTGVAQETRCGCFGYEHPKTREKEVENAKIRKAEKDGKEKTRENLQGDSWPTTLKTREEADAWLREHKKTCSWCGVMQSMTEGILPRIAKSRWFHTGSY